MARRRSTDTKRSRIDNWDDQRDEILLEVLKEQQSLGKGVGGHFPYDLWPIIIQAFNRKTDLALGRENLKNRLKVLKRTFALYQSIVRKNGWEWDDERNIPKPESPSQWNEIIACSPTYAKCKGKPFPRYRDMEFLCGGKRSMLGAADLGVTKKSRRRVPIMTRLHSAEAPLGQYKVDGIQPVLQPAANSANPSQQDGEASSEEQPSSFSSEKRQQHASDIPMKVMVDIDHEQPKIYGEKDDQVTASKAKAYTIEDCMKKLEKVEGIIPDAFVAACEGFKDPDNRTIFMNLGGPYLSSWVDRQMKIDCQLMTQVRQQLLGSISASYPSPILGPNKLQTPISGKTSSGPPRSPR